MDGLARAGHHVLHIIYKSEQAGDSLIWIWGLKVSLYFKKFEEEYNMPSNSILWDQKLKVVLNYD